MKEYGHYDPVNRTAIQELGPRYDVVDLSTRWTESNFPEKNVIESWNYFCYTHREKNLHTENIKYRPVL